MRLPKKKLLHRATRLDLFSAYCIIIVSQHNCMGPDATYTSLPHHTQCQMSPTYTRHLQERDDQCG